MKALVTRLVLSGVLVPALVQAQSLNPNRTTLRLFEQGGGFVLRGEQRVFTLYCNTLRTHYIGVEATAGTTRGVSANRLFGAGKEGWQPGIYKVTCSDSRPLGETTFQMSPGPSLLASTELRLKDVRFFVTGPELTAPAQREYLLGSAREMAQGRVPGHLPDAWTAPSRSIASPSGELS